MKKNINMKNKNIILQSTYRKYKEWSATKYHDFIQENPDSDDTWKPYTFENFCLKAFDYNDVTFMDKFDIWFDESKLEFK